MMQSTSVKQFKAQTTWLKIASGHQGLSFTERPETLSLENVEYQTHGARIVSMAPELSLATIGETIPIIEVPADLPYPTVKEMAFVLTQIGHMVMHREVPKHTIETMGDTTKAIPNVYAKGKRALTLCSEILRQSR